MCVHFSQVTLSNLILADHAGSVVEGKYAINRAGFVSHAAVHEAQPDVVAMCHAHTPYAGIPVRVGLIGARLSNRAFARFGFAATVSWNWPNPPYDLGGVAIRNPYRLYTHFVTQLPWIST